MEAENLTQAVAWAVLFSGIFLWVGMLTGIWKYYQIRQSAQARAHYYVDIAHRSSLLYAPASLIIAVLAYFSVWNELLNLILVLINLFFFSFSILSYILHGWLKDTTNQFKQPHQVGRWHLPKWMLSSAMILLIIGELGATAGLLLGTMMGLGKILI
ncbi:hypothetical protein H0920_04445 [Acinetobacter sp. C_4_1]|uniref:hypothetical protein n=1 Tax=unclassified Acinetobacter TaxID=196816 RepID=UPI0021B77172|nr:MULTISPECIES: hypothetical protein [unclassified Acinetobacter]MCT8088331.1 hypothetical protein [Acinetobacter sp. F_3_1]MCT8097700.1 hypothetical protein [Acinetobacter sp. C_3_1]MCT8100356.1 hypothetical protein [Acinetobacter sp. C_4_1]MCT8133925.1 hypothetical protein [Acinetobacter sp. T_3_1]